MSWSASAQMQAVHARGPRGHVPAILVSGREDSFPAVAPGARQDLRALCGNLRHRHPLRVVLPSVGNRPLRLGRGIFAPTRGQPHLRQHRLPHPAQPGAHPHRDSLEIGQVGDEVPARLRLARLGEIEGVAIPVHLPGAIGGGGGDVAEGVEMGEQAAQGLRLGVALGIRRLRLHQNQSLCLWRGGGGGRR